jgi:hypothetical protein
MNLDKIALAELLAEVTELVNIASVRVHWRSSMDLGTVIVWVRVFGQRGVT